MIFRINKHLLILLICTALMISGYSPIKGVRGFKSVESYIGKSITEVSQILAKENIKSYGAPVTEDNLEVYTFYEGSQENLGSEMIFIVESNKVVACGVVFDYENENDVNSSDSEGGDLEGDLNLLKKALREAGYKITKEKESNIQYQKTEKGYAALIEVDEVLGYFGFYLGKTELLKSMDIIDKSETLVLSENFSTNANNWFTGENDEYSIKLIGGAYQIQSKRGGTWFGSREVKLNTQGNFEISVDIKKISGPNDYYFGLILGFDTGPGYFYLSGITGSQDYVYADKGKNSVDLIQTSNSAIYSGNATNHMRLVKSGSKMSCYVNGTFLGETDFDGFYGTYFGFRIWSGDQPMIIQFDNFEIKTFE